MKSYIPFFLMIFILASCGPKVIYTSEIKTDKPWTYGDEWTYEYEISDVEIPYDLILSVSHTVEFPYENMYVTVSTTFPDGKKTVNPVSLQLADLDGSWLGDCSGGTCVVDISMSSQAYFTQKGKYNLTFGQYSRQDSLSGISSLKLQVVQSPQK